MIRNVEILTAAVEAVRTELQQYRETWIDRREALIGIITGHCTDSQGACRKLVGAQIETMEKGQDNICHKIDEMQKRRSKRWEKQDQLNSHFSKHINDTKLHNNQ